PRTGRLPDAASMLPSFSKSPAPIPCFRSLRLLLDLMVSLRFRSMLLPPGLV
ncbi:unnamed protein product, partial [Citrullus colocynthis]